MLVSYGDESLSERAIRSSFRRLFEAAKKSSIGFSLVAVETGAVVVFVAVSFVTEIVGSANGFAIRTIGLLSSDSSGKSCHTLALMPFRSG